LENAAVTGKILLNGLKDFAKRFPGHLKNARGVGTFCAFDCASPAERDNLIELLKVEGIQSGSCGPYSVRLRPSLIFQPHHAHIYLEKLEQTLKKLDQRV